MQPANPDSTDSAGIYGLVPDHSLLRLAGLWIAASFAILFIISMVVWESSSLGMDFGVYWRVANAPVSLAYEHQVDLNFPYPPTMLLWISPLSLVPKWPAYGLWVGISVAAFVASSHRHLDRSALILALIAPPVFYCLLTGQVSMVLGALILWACTTRHRLGAGIALGVVASVKPQLVLMAPMLLAVNKDLRALVAAAGALGGLTLISVAAFGFSSWAGWLQMLEYFRTIVIRNGVLNVTITPASVASLWNLPPLPFLLIGATLGALLIIKCRKALPLAQGAAIVTASLLAAPYAVTYDLAALAPFLAWAITRGRIIALIPYTAGLNVVPLLTTAFELTTITPKAPTN